MDFEKGTSIDAIFNKIEEIMKKKQDGASKRVLDIYNSAHEKPQTARAMFAAIKEDCKLDCGCCYKLSEPALDIAVTELTMLQFMIDEVENIAKRTNNKEILDMFDHNKRIMQTMIVGLKELGMGNVNLYEATMKIYARTFQMGRSIPKKEPFDHIVGMEEAISRIVEEAKTKK